MRDPKLSKCVGVFTFHTQVWLLKTAKNILLGKNGPRAIHNRSKPIKEEKMTVWPNVCTWEYERFQIRKTQGENVIKENTCSRFKMGFLIHCRKKQYLKYLPQAAEETFSYYVKKTQKNQLPFYDRAGKF